MPVVHVVLDQDSALAELPAAASGQPDAPISSGLGSNANAEPESRKVPQAIIFGTGISREDIAKVQEAVAEVASGVKSVIVTEDEVDAADTDSLAQVVKAKLAAALQA